MTNARMRLDGRTAVVTGGASGIGLALVRQLGARGARVVLVDRDGDAAKQAADLLTGGGLSVVPRQLDVTERGAIQSLLGEVSSGRTLDYVFNNAGVGGSLAFDAATAEHWDQIIALNLRAVVDGTAAAYAIMSEQGHGHIINTASVAGLVPVPLQTLYNTTKYGVVGLSTSLRPEAAARGVKVTVICPGNVATNIFAVPILGPPSQHPAIPANAVPADDAAQTILDGVDRNRDVIVFPEVARRLVRWHRFRRRRWHRWAEREYRRRARGQNDA